MIGVPCPSCSKRFEVTPKLAGRRVRCTQCHTTFRVPVPTVMPSAREKPKRGGLDELFEEPGEVSEPVSPAISSSRSAKKTSITDLGSSRVFLLMFYGSVLALGFAAVKGDGARERWAAILCIVVGAFELVSSSARWESYSRSWRCRVVSAIFGEDGTRFLHQLAGSGLVVAAMFLLSGVIAWPFAAPKAVVEEKAIAAPDPAKEPDAAVENDP